MSRATRNLGREASEFAKPGELIKIKENRIGCRRGIASWDCLYKYPKDPRGKCRVTLIAWKGERFDDDWPLLPYGKCEDYN